MFQKIADYFQDNPNYVIVLAISFVIIAVIIAIICIAYKKGKKNNAKNKNAEQNVTISTEKEQLTTDKTSEKQEIQNKNNNNIDEKTEIIDNVNSPAENTKSVEVISSETKITENSENIQNTDITNQNSDIAKTNENNTSDIAKTNENDNNSNISNNDNNLIQPQLSENAFSKEISEINDKNEVKDMKPDKKAPVKDASKKTPKPAAKTQQMPKTEAKAVKPKSDAKSTVKSNPETKTTAKVNNGNVTTLKSAEKAPIKKLTDSKKKNDNDDQSKYKGKWVIAKDEIGRYYADLKASNGEVMLRSESYSSLSGIKSGIETLKKNIENNNYAINIDKNGNFVFKIFSTAQRLLCVGEGYSTREQCEKAFASVKRFAKTASTVVSKL